MVVVTILVLIKFIDEITGLKDEIRELDANFEIEKLYIRMEMEFKADAINELEIEIERLKRYLENYNLADMLSKADADITVLDKVNDAEGVIRADIVKRGVVSKSCSIDGKCNYMDKFTTVK